MPLLIGCTGNRAPAPTVEESLEGLAVPVWRFIDQAKKQSKSDQVLQDLGILMEALDAQAESTGGKLTELRDAAAALQADLQGGTDKSEAIQSFEDKVRPLVAEPSSLE